jgi:hydroxyacylglutathione hydrolase
MLFRQLYDTPLAQASYLIGCQASGEAIVVDPLRDIEPVLALAQREGLRIVAVTETHIHADFCSGLRELAARTGARAYLSGEGGPEWQYAFAAGDGATLLRDGDTIRLGNIVLTALHTPGHTPEHLSFLVTDGAATDRPMGLLTGDFVFVGDVGRPDLLERAAHMANTMEAGARTLWTSLRKLDAYPDWLQLWPGHGAGSACGKSLGAVPQSTLGYERLVNWAFQVRTEAAFVDAVLAGQPEPPAYFAQMKRINKEGPPVLGGLPSPRRASPLEAHAWLGDGLRVVDVRDAASYAARHLAGTINIPLGKSFVTWAGALLAYDRDVLVLAPDEAAGDRVARDLMTIGYDRVAAVVDADAALAGAATDAIPQVSPVALLGALGTHSLTVLDVRGRSEWAEGHLEGAVHIPLPELQDRLAEVPQGGTLVVQCAGGGRSAIAASVLRAAGVPRVENLAGGLQAWRAQGLPVVTETSTATPA